jgi:hypothetical protein
MGTGTQNLWSAFEPSTALQRSGPCHKRTPEKHQLLQQVRSHVPRRSSSSWVGHELLEVCTALIGAPALGRLAEGFLSLLPRLRVETRTRLPTSWADLQRRGSASKKVRVAPSVTYVASGQCVAFSILTRDVDSWGRHAPQHDSCWG